MSGMFVVCHMLASLDGKIDGAFSGLQRRLLPPGLWGAAKYYGCQATLYGTTTMLGGYG